MSQIVCSHSHMDRIVLEIPSLSRHPGFDVLVGLMETIEDRGEIDSTTANLVFQALMDAYATGRQSKKSA